MDSRRSGDCCALGTISAGGLLLLEHDLIRQTACRRPATRDSVWSSRETWRILRVTAGRMHRAQRFAATTTVVRRHRASLPGKSAALISIDAMRPFAIALETTLARQPHGLCAGLNRRAARSRYQKIHLPLERRESAERFRVENLHEHGAAPARRRVGATVPGETAGHR
jgi:hypothetical protein